MNELDKESVTEGLKVIHKDVEDIIDSIQNKRDYAWDITDDDNWVSLGVIIEDIARKLNIKL
jgi:hypothetical protein